MGQPQGFAPPPAPQTVPSPQAGMVPIDTVGGFAQLPAGRENFYVSKLELKAPSKEGNAPTLRLDLQVSGGPHNQTAVTWFCYLAGGSGAAMGQLLEALQIPIENGQFNMYLLQGRTFNAEVGYGKDFFKPKDFRMPG